MAGKPKKPDITTLPILHTIYWPSRDNFYSATGAFHYDVPCTLASRNPAMIQGDVECWLTTNESKNRDKNYWIIKYIPVAVLEPAYKQQRIPPQTVTS